MVGGELGGAGGLDKIGKNKKIRQKRRELREKKSSRIAGKTGLSTSLFHYTRLGKKNSTRQRKPYSLKKNN